MSAAFAPPSRARGIPMFCYCVNRYLFILLVLTWPDSRRVGRSFSEANHFQAYLQPIAKAFRYPTGSRSSKTGPENAPMASPAGAGIASPCMAASYRSGR
jgi:hypothetical protein